jgi:hypothetical protein
MGLTGKELPLNWTSIIRRPDLSETICSGIEEMEQSWLGPLENGRQKFENKPANAQHGA